jgi:glycosyltransferase involved in cell wall biosynthesis
MAEGMGLSSIVSFSGTMTREATIEAMSKAHLLIFPSLRDSGGSAVAEAMALGLPVLALSLAGPASMLRDGGGFLIDAQNPKRAIANIRLVLDQLLDDRRPLLIASRRGIEMARQSLGWDQRIRTFEEICRRAMATRYADNPNYDPVRTIS